MLLAYLVKVPATPAIDDLNVMHDCVVRVVHFATYLATELSWDLAHVRAMKARTAKTTTPRNAAVSNIFAFI